MIVNVPKPGIVPLTLKLAGAVNVPVKGYCPLGTLKENALDEAAAATAGTLKVPLARLPRTFNWTCPMVPLETARVELKVRSLGRELEPPLQPESKGTMGKASNSPLPNKARVGRDNKVRIIVKRAVVKL